MPNFRQDLSEPRILLSGSDVRVQRGSARTQDLLLSSSVLSFEAQMIATDSVASTCVVA